MKVTLYTLILLFCCRFASAQYDQNFKALGDRSFKNKNFYEAAYFYRKAADQSNITQQAQQIPYQARTEKKIVLTQTEANYLSFQLAESYRGYENYLEAEGWYYKLLNAGADRDHPLARYWYGVCLRANQHFEDAIKQLDQFKNSYHGERAYVLNADKEIANCKFAIEQYKYPMLIEANKMKGEWNSDGSNYAMIKRDDNYFFTSSRIVKDDKRRLNKLYQSKGFNSVPQILKIDIAGEKKNEEYGTPAFSADGSKMYFTRWYREGAKTICSIFKAEMTGGVWGTAKPLNSNVNLESFNALQPFVTVDSKRLYFVSDKPGGQGGQDIWFAELGSDGDAVNSTNLGSAINTEKDEQAPFYDLATKRLVYSSKGMTGLGGFDLYESQGDVGYFAKPKNMGYPINSAKDDLYYQPDKMDDTKFYLSSDRESDCCLDLFQMTDKRYVLAGLVTDCDSKKPLAGVKVTFLDSITKDVVAEITTGRDAKYNFRVATTRPFQMRLEKDKYFSKVLPGVRPNGQMMKDTLMSPEICLQPFEVNRPIVIDNVLYDYAKADLRPESKTVLNTLVTILKDNPSIKVELSAHTDSIGSDAYNNALSQSRAQACVDYIVTSGVDSARIFAKGYGKTKPKAPNSLPNGADNPEGRQINRRTEFTVLKLDNTITKVADQ